MSREREAFEQWHDALFDISAATVVKNEYGYPQNGYVQMRWRAWQACASHCQQLLDAKDAEIARLNEQKFRLTELGRYVAEKDGRFIRCDEFYKAPKSSLQEENTTLKALLEQSREALELADASLRGANMNMSVVEKKIKQALADYHAAGLVLESYAKICTDLFLMLQRKSTLTT